MFVLEKIRKRKKPKHGHPITARRNFFGGWWLSTHQTNTIENILTPQTQQQKNVDNTPERERERRKTPVLKYNDNNHRNNGRLVGVFFFHDLLFSFWAVIFLYT
jgi:hypothetical protein